MKARAADAVEEEAHTDPKVLGHRKPYINISIFDIHVLLLLACSGDGGSIESADTILERRQFPKSAESALPNLRKLAKRGYIEETEGRKFHLTEEGIRFVNAVMR